MSTATIVSTQEQEPLERTLRDYALHISKPTNEYEPGRALAPATTSTTPAEGNPTNWPSQYRRVPPYRPINRNLDLSERPNGSNRGELLFVTVMMNGVRLQSGLVRAWEQTGGHWYPGLTRYKIGGEW